LNTRRVLADDHQEDELHAAQEEHGDHAPGTAAPLISFMKTIYSMATNASV